LGKNLPLASETFPPTSIVQYNIDGTLFHTLFCTLRRTPKVAASVIHRSPLLFPSTRRATHHHSYQEVRPNAPQHSVQDTHQDALAPYIPQYLTQSQFDTLHAAAHLIVQSPGHHHLAARVDAALADHKPHTISQFDYCHGLDQLDALTRDRTSYGFAELPSDVQQAVLNLIASGDLTTPQFDLASWLEDLRHNVAAAL
jgi:hypothetical protein